MFQSAQFRNDYSNFFMLSIEKAFLIHTTNICMNMLSHTNCRSFFFSTKKKLKFSMVLLNSSFHLKAFDCSAMINECHSKNEDWHKCYEIFKIQWPEFMAIIYEKWKIDVYYTKICCRIFMIFIKSAHKF